MTTRADMMLLALLVLITLMGVLSIVVGRRGRTSVALERYGWGALISAAGLGITLLAVLPVPLRMFFGNALIALGTIPIASGVLLHTRFRLDLRLVGLFYAVTLAALGWNNFHPSARLSVNFLMTLPLSNALYAFVAYALLRDPPRDARRAALMVALGFVLSRAVADLHVALYWLGFETIDDRNRFDIIACSFSLAQMVIAVANTVALLWLEVRKMEAELERMAFEDALTHLPNRRAIRAHFEQEIARAARRGESFALVIFDIDRFKTVNDTYGHQAGDAMLAHVAATLNGARRADDLLGRIGGEEFMLVLTGLDPAAAFDAVDRFRERVATGALAWGGLCLTATMSGGYALYPNEGTSWDELFAVADMRLYEAKQAGRNCVMGPAVNCSRDRFPRPADAPAARR